MPNIFSQIKVKELNFSNRIVIAPMVHFGYKNKMEIWKKNYLIHI